MTAMTTKKKNRRGMGGESDILPVVINKDKDTVKRIMEMFPQDFVLQCSDGITIAAQRWKIKNNAQQKSRRNKQRKILCIHGFLDNCRSFYWLAPNLLEYLHTSRNNNDDDDVASSATTTVIETELVAIDLPGHGKSSHHSKDHPPNMIISDYVFYIAEVVRLLQWQSLNDNDDDDGNTHGHDDGFILIGHSMGAAISIMYNATFPNTVRQLFLLDGNGPDTQYEEDHEEILLASQDKLRKTNINDTTKTTNNTAANHVHGSETNMSNSTSKIEATAAATATTATETTPKSRSYFSQRLRDHVIQRYNGNKKLYNNDHDTHTVGTKHDNSMTTRKKKKKVYPHLRAAIWTRQQTARKCPGHQWISVEAGKELVVRATTTATVTSTTAAASTGTATNTATTRSTMMTRTKSKENNNVDVADMKEDGYKFPNVHNESEYTDKDDNTSNMMMATTMTESEGIQFIHDSRLQWSPLLLHTDDQVDDYFWNITTNDSSSSTSTTKIYWFRAKYGWPFSSSILNRAVATILFGKTKKSSSSTSSSDDDDDTMKNVDYSKNKLIVKYFSGSHHFHADPDTANDIVQAIGQYILLSCQKEKFTS